MTEQLTLARAVELGELMTKHPQKQCKKRKEHNQIRQWPWGVLVVLLITIAAFLCSHQKGSPSEENLPDPSFGSTPIPSVPDTTAASNPHTGSPADPSDWRLILVNPWNPLPEDHSISLTELRNDHAIDERAYPDLQAMMDAARAEGLYPLICSSYRTQETQQRLYDQKVSQYLAAGYSREVAEAEAGKWVAFPGTSEHQTGLAVDIVASGYQILDEQQERTAEQQWLMKNSYKYGFILRYPTAKSDITGINYEPWHYRYVGKEAAKEIYEKGLCLEEYLERAD